ncbi:hypothetical protein F5Y04DRAFT_254766 [Hypomontagnella monticulosa]|nr:hypothetical protein F5Y04DRAFT_254766 [Hypomontagnella monticulosa]
MASVSFFSCIELLLQLHLHLRLTYITVHALSRLARTSSNPCYFIRPRIDRAHGCIPSFWRLIYRKIPRQL